MSLAVADAFELVQSDGELQVEFRAGSASKPGGATPEFFGAVQAPADERGRRGLAA